MSLPRGISRVLDVCWFLLVLVTTVAVFVSCVAFLSQAVRAAPNESWTDNVNAVIVGASYVAVLVISLAYCLKRRIAVRRRLSRISKVYKTIGRNDVRKSVHEYIAQEYARACLIAFESQPREGFQEGWGRPGTQHEGVNFRRALLDTIPKIDELTRQVIPRLPPLRPHERMLLHFRHSIPLLSKDEAGLTPLHYYDSAIQLARHSSREPTEREYEVGLSAALQIQRILFECHLEMQQGSTTDLTRSNNVES